MSNYHAHAKTQDSRNGLATEKLDSTANSVRNPNVNWILEWRWNGISLCCMHVCVRRLECTFWAARHQLFILASKSRQMTTRKMLTIRCIFCVYVDWFSHWLTNYEFSSTQTHNYTFSSNSMDFMGLFWRLLFFPYVHVQNVLLQSGFLFWLNHKNHIRSICPFIFVFAIIICGRSGFDFRNRNLQTVCEVIHQSRDIVCSKQTNDDLNDSILSQWIFAEVVWLLSYNIEMHAAIMTHTLHLYDTWNMSATQFTMDKAQQLIN